MGKLDDVIVQIAYNRLLDKFSEPWEYLENSPAGTRNLYQLAVIREFEILLSKETIHFFYRYSPMQRYKQLNPFNVRFTRTDRTCTETKELQYGIQNDTAYNTTSTQHQQRRLLSAHARTIPRFLGFSYFSENKQI